MSTSSKLLCGDIIIDETIQAQGETNYVFATLNPGCPSTWLLSCSCAYDSTDYTKWVPRYNIYDPIWRSEQNCVNNFSTICNHMQKCIAAKCVFACQTTELPIYYDHMKKELEKMGDDWEEKASIILDNLTPIPWVTNRNPQNRSEIVQYTRHGIGTVPIIDDILYRVQMLKPCIWKCDCKDFSNINNCTHILYIKKREEFMQNRREMCINLAQKVIERIQIENLIQMQI